jgi:hypothetical protein
MMPRTGQLGLGQTPELGEVIAEVHHEVPDLLGGPSTVRVRGRTQ